ncbi:MAG: LamG-like jellyroll fold domain-containing protein, partial [bacterium]|nr:LamG-like jellyroll fold domain-containing protein [bacterium]
MKLLITKHNYAVIATVVIALAISFILIFDIYPNQPAEAAMYTGIVGEWLFNEPEVGVANDTSINNNNGADVSTTLTSAGKYGNARVFNGSTSYVDVGASEFGIAGGTNEFSLSAWVKVSSVITNWEAIIARGQYLYPFSLHMVNWGQPLFQFGVRTTVPPTNYINSSAINLNQWYHVVATYKDGQQTLYLNGQLVVSAPTSGNVLSSSPNERTWIGRLPSSVGGSFSGVIDEVKIYNKALSEDEVAFDYVAGPRPAAYWNFDETAGVTASDSSGNAHTGTLTNTGVNPLSTWEAGKVGGAISMNYGGNYIAVADDAGLALPESFSITAWINGDDLSAEAYQIIYVDMAPGFVPWYWEFGINSSTQKLESWMNNGNQLIANTALVNNKWHHVAMTWDGTARTYYLNGANDGGGAGVNVVGNDTVNIGGQMASSNYGFHGLIDELKVYNYARTDEQIKQDVTVGYWQFDENAGAFTLDISGQGNSGTISNGSWVANGIFNKALDYNGANSYVNVGTMDIPSDEFTVSVWFSADEISGSNCASGDCTLISKAYGAALAEQYWSLGTVMDAGDLKLVFRLKTGGTTSELIANSGFISTTNQNWAQAVAVYDGVQMALYKDGALVGTLAKSGSVDTSSSASVLVGANPLGAPLSGISRPWSGVIDEVQIYNVAMDIPAINNLFSSYGTPICGNGTLEYNEFCDDGNFLGSDYCSNECLVIGLCGDSIQQSNEGCDDGNTTPGDTCSSECQLEGINPRDILSFAWSENIGWISHNVKDCDIDGDGTYEGSDEGDPAGSTPAPADCPGTPFYVTAQTYGVEINNLGELSGYAWGDKIGWVSFNRKTCLGGADAGIGCNDYNECSSNVCSELGPGAAGTPPQASFINPSDDPYIYSSLPYIAKFNNSGIYPVEGWAKILNLEDEGWISLRGNSADGVHLNETAEFYGWGWNGNVNGHGVGWVSFNSTGCDVNDDWQYDGVAEGASAFCPAGGQTVYDYEVIANILVGTPTITGVIPTPGLRCSALTIVWDDLIGEEGYRLYEVINVGDTPESPGADEITAGILPNGYLNPDITSYTHTGLIPGGSYNYISRAFKDTFTVDSGPPASTGATDFVCGVEADSINTASYSECPNIIH